MIPVCTNFEQSRRLMKLGLDPAMTGWRLKLFGPEILPVFSYSNGFYYVEPGEIPAWSLSDLIEILSSNNNDEFFLKQTKKNWIAGYRGVITKTSEDVYDVLISLLECLK